MTAVITRLPTAARRKVQQRSIRAVRQFKAENPWPGVSKPPHVRDAEASVSQVGRSPELLILLALLKSLPDAQRQAIKDTVHRIHFAVGDEVSLAACSLLSGIGRDR
ncbi:hypothetical protein [Sphingobium sp. CAP-1]|uniref:hypothetical protein n=1 Tax=Sphingobium sp. CAP-1 TaxID=2676077 RepID=UPI0012BB2919|nr:hypothetical protein [Sphingobium sp. CAP-1]QGP80024.1 hypothetical protein GL174_14285 [Sphingobium sp. CAP-1]